MEELADVCLFHALYMGNALPYVKGIHPETFNIIIAILTLETQDSDARRPFLVLCVNQRCLRSVAMKKVKLRY